MERYYYASDEALKEMECAYEYRCRECGSLFWGHLHGLGDIDKVQCPLCGITGVRPLSYVEPTGNKKRRGSQHTEKDESVCFNAQMQIMEFMRDLMGIQDI